MSHHNIKISSSSSYNNNNNNNNNKGSDESSAKALLAGARGYSRLAINHNRLLMANSNQPAATTYTATTTPETPARSATISRQPLQNNLNHYYPHYSTSESNNGGDDNPIFESVFFDAAQATNWKPKISPSSSSSSSSSSLSSPEATINQLRYSENVYYIDNNNLGGASGDTTWCESPISKAISNNYQGSSSSSSSINITDNCDINNSTSTILSTTELYNKILPAGSFDFKTEESDFSVMQELWIRKSWTDISIRVAFVAPIVLIGILGNLTIIYSMCKFKNFRSKPTNIFILNMAIADLLTTMVCPIAALVKDIYQFYVLGSFICRFEGFVKITCLLVSSYSLIVLSLDWLLCVIKPCRTRISIKHSWLALTAVWITSVLMASPLFVWRKLRHRQWRDFVETWCCELIQYTKYYWVGITFFLIYLPTCIMIIVFVIILAQMDKFEAKLRRSCDNSQSSHSLSINIKYRRRIVKIIFAYLLTSIICWTPLQFTVIYRHFRSEPTFSPWFSELAFFAQLSASLTAVTNPIIFGFLSQPFRKLVTKSFMLKFLDKIVTTHNGSPIIGGGARHNGDRNQILPMNQRHNQRSNNNDNTNGFRNYNNQSDQNRLSDRLENHTHQQRVMNLKEVSPNHQTYQRSIILAHKKNRNASRSSNQQQVFGINSTATNAEKTSQNNNNNNKRVSFHTSVMSASSMRNREFVINNEKNNGETTFRSGGGCENKAYEPETTRSNQNNNNSNHHHHLHHNSKVDNEGEINIYNTQNNQQRGQQPISTTTSFIQMDHQLLGLSLVSMDSINIEESIADIGHDEGEVFGNGEQKE